MSAVGFTLLALGGALAVLNLYLYFVRRPLVAAFGTTGKDIRHVSGVPVIASVLLVLAIWLLPWSWPSWVGVVLLALDSGSVAWFLLVIWWSQLRRSGGA
jgi:hypothetical protein